MTNPAHLWRGVIEEYRDWLPVTDTTPVITLLEGGTPLVYSPWLSGVVKGDAWLKVEGSNPTGSFKDRGMTMAMSIAVGEGAQAVVCASTGNTSASMSAYAARAGITPIVLVPEGKIAAGKMAQAIMHGGQVIQVRGGFDECLELSRALADKYPVALVNSVNPMRIQGQKTASFEVIDALGKAPDVHSSSWQCWQHFGLLARLSRISRRWNERQNACDVGISGGRCGADRAWCSGCQSRNYCQRDPHREPGVVAACRSRT